MYKPQIRLYCYQDEEDKIQQLLWHNPFREYKEYRKSSEEELYTYEHYDLHIIKIKDIGRLQSERGYRPSKVIMTEKVYNSLDDEIKTMIECKLAINGIVGSTKIEVF